MQARYSLALLAVLIIAGLLTARPTMAQPWPGDTPENVRVLLDNLPVLEHTRGDRPLLYQYSVGDLSALNDQEAAQVLKALAARGVGVITFWEVGNNHEVRIQEGLRIGRLQDSLGLEVAVDATRILYGFYVDSTAYAHLDAEGNHYFDQSFAGRVMGCPFTLEDRKPIIRSRVASYIEAYQSAGIPVDVVTADWEIDGPHEWNNAWENSKRCRRGQENIPNIESFEAFQAKMRTMRAKLLYDTYVNPIRSRYPDAKITNYAVYPHNGWRYWYDYFEEPNSSLPHRMDQKAPYRPWYPEFTETGLTMAMAVVYTWYPIHNWYPEFSDSDYRWFYNMLKVGSNAGKSTPSGIPLSTFVHWHTTSPPENPSPSVQQMSKNAYRELLWHLLLRGHDRLYSWCRDSELPEEMTLLQSVYDASLAYSDWLTYGVPINFEVPKSQGAVISGLRWNNRVLVRRTDFGPSRGPVSIDVAGQTLKVPVKPGGMQVLQLD